MQTAKTIAPQTSELGFGIAYNDMDVEELNRNTLFPELYFRRGLSESSDFGLKLTPIGTTIDIKKNFWLSPFCKSALAWGLMADFYILDRQRLLGLQLPFYFSLHPSDGLAFYTSVRGGFVNDRNFSYGESTLNLVYAGAAGFRAGSDRVGMFIEYVYSQSPETAVYPAFQVNGGLRFNVTKE